MRTLAEQQDYLAMISDPKLLAAARKLFSDYGYQNTAVTEIAKIAGVSHALRGEFD